MIAVLGGFQLDIIKLHCLCICYQQLHESCGDALTPLARLGIDVEHRSHAAVGEVRIRRHLSHRKKGGTDYLSLVLSKICEKVAVEMICIVPRQLRIYPCRLSICHKREILAQILHSYFRKSGNILCSENIHMLSPSFVWTFLDLKSLNIEIPRTKRKHKENAPPPIMKARWTFFCSEYEGT